MKNQTSNTFSSDNFLLCAFLLSKGCKLVSVNKSNPRRVIFYFQDSEKRESLTDKFLSSQAQVEPHKLFSSMKDLKQIIYEEKNKYENSIYSNSK